jgi:hypothetical protein
VKTYPLLDHGELIRNIQHQQPNTAEAAMAATLRIEPGGAPAELFQRTNESTSAGDRTTIILIVTVLITLGGIVPRARGISRTSGWMRRGLRIRPSRNRSSKHFTLAWLQTSPPGFLILVRWTNRLLGLSNASLRVVPFVSGVAALICMAYLSFKLLSPLAATWSVALFSFAPLSISSSSVSN